MAGRIHHPALPYQDLPKFWARLSLQDGMGALALRFAILTAARSGEVRHATWSEIRREERLWVIHGEKMKAGREHRVPLCDEAWEILNTLPRIVGADTVFCSPRGKALSDATLSAVLKRMEVPAVPHGFRSTFKDWVSEETSYPSELSEMALAHAVADKVEAAYRRGDMLTKRRQLMQDWSDHCHGRWKSNVVVPISMSSSRKK